MDLDWNIRRIKIETDEQQLLEGNVQGLLTVPNTSGELYFPAESPGVEDLVVTKNTQPDVLVPLIRISQNDSESIESFHDRVSLFCAMWVHRLSVAVAPPVPTVQHPAAGFTLVKSFPVPLRDANKVAIYVQVLCHARPI